jgi:putative membrane protein
MMYWGNGMGGWGMVFMTVSFLLFWGVVIGGIVLLARSFGGGAQRAVAIPQPPTPQQVLAERFARGEIDEDEYRHRLQVLRDPGSTQGMDD